jgi:hypothetical protein
VNLESINGDLLGDTGRLLEENEKIEILLLEREDE